MSQELQDMIRKRNAKQREYVNLQTEIDDLDKSIQRFNEMPAAERLAVLLHGKLCRFNHSDGCGWEYEVVKGQHNWTGRDHKMWLSRAKNAVARIPAEGVNPENIERWLAEIL